MAINEYWLDKEKRAELAKEHTQLMEKLYPDLIKDSIRDTIHYFPGFECKKKLSDTITEIIVEDIDSVSAIMKYGSKKGNDVAVLNFASYKNPGGRFIDGSKAQEECLCHESFLYNVLKEHQDYYDWNNERKNKALYLNRALFTYNVLFIKRDDVFDPSKEAFMNCNVITCAAPNKTAAQKYCNVSDETNTKVLKDRIKFLLDIAKCHEQKTLILGAYGCGVFGQDPEEVANIFKEYLTTTHKCFEKVIFAVPKGNNENLSAFEKVFEGK